MYWLTGFGDAGQCTIGGIGRVPDVRGFRCKRGVCRACWQVAIE